MVTRVAGVVGPKAATLVASVVLVFAMALPAVAASFCSQLQDQYLSAVRSGGGGSSNAGQIRRQLASAQAEAKSKNCRRLGIFVKPARDCPAVMSKLSRLQSQASQASGTVFRRPTSSRERLYDELRRNGCQVPTLGETASSGYRTLCVRTCDGYYFPVNFRSSRSRFKVDETVCKSMYGGASAELFIHANGRSADQAVSLQGRPLAAEPYAFAYRTKFSDSCQGELKSGLASLEKVFATRIPEFGTNAPAPVPAGIEARAIFPVPVARVNRSQDPETLANLAGKFVVTPVTPVDPDEIVVAGTTIRRLGPEYYYIAPPTISALYEPPDLGPEFSLISSAQAADRVDKDTGRTGSTVVQ